MGVKIRDCFSVGLFFFFVRKETLAMVGVILGGTSSSLFQHLASKSLIL